MSFYVCRSCGLVPSGIGPPTRCPKCGCAPSPAIVDTRPGLWAVVQFEDDRERCTQLYETEREARVALGAKRDAAKPENSAGMVSYPSGTKFRLACFRGEWIDEGSETR